MIVRIVVHFLISWLNGRLHAYVCKTVSKYIYSFMSDDIPSWLTYFRSLSNLYIVFSFTFFIEMQRKWHKLTSNWCVLCCVIWRVLRHIMKYLWWILYIHRRRDCFVKGWFWNSVSQSDEWCRRDTRLESSHHDMKRYGLWWVDFFRKYVLLQSRALLRSGSDD